MYIWLLRFSRGLILVSVLSYAFHIPSQAEALSAPRFASSPYEVVNAVNDLRASYGLPAYIVNDILMAAAQAHADYMAATGNVSHTGLGGSSATDRLLSLGYPLAGDLSLGGFRSENITSGNEGMTAQEAVSRWTRDAPHLNTMISPNLTEIGAGVSINAGRVYYVIDAAQPSGSRIPQESGMTTVPEGPTLPPGVSGIMIPVIVATPNPNGDVIHEVKAGQTLWQIAISYNTKIDEIKRLNNLFDNEIYPNMKLLVKKGLFLTATVLPQTSAPGAASSPVILPTLTASPFIRTQASLPAATQPVASSGNTVGIAIGIIVLAILGGGLVAWWGSQKKQK